MGRSLVQFPSAEELYREYTKFLPHCILRTLCRRAAMLRRRVVLFSFCRSRTLWGVYKIHASRSVSAAAELYGEYTKFPHNCTLRTLCTRAAMLRWRVVSFSFCRSRTLWRVYKIPASLYLANVSRKEAMLRWGVVSFSFRCSRTLWGVYKIPASLYLENVLQEGGHVATESSLVQFLPQQNFMESIQNSCLTVP
jgi:hypothetical protein